MAEARIATRFERLEKEIFKRSPSESTNEFESLAAKDSISEARNATASGRTSPDVLPATATSKPARRNAHSTAIWKRAGKGFREQLHVLSKSLTMEIAVAGRPLREARRILPVARRTGHPMERSIATADWQIGVHRGSSRTKSVEFACEIRADSAPHEVTLTFPVLNSLLQPRTGPSPPPGACGWRSREELAVANVAAAERAVEGASSA